jgi:hypothetical protein
MTYNCDGIIRWKVRFDIDCHEIVNFTLPLELGGERLGGDDGLDLVRIVSLVLWNLRVHGYRSNSN